MSLESGWPLGDVYMIAGYSKKGRMNMLAEMLCEFKIGFGLEVRTVEEVLRRKENKVTWAIDIAKNELRGDIKLLLAVVVNEYGELEIELTDSNQTITARNLDYLCKLQERIDYWNENLVL